MSTGELVVVFLLVIAVLSCVAGRWLREARLELERGSIARKVERTVEDVFGCSRNPCREHGDTTRPA